jgi:hypothetical protein
VTTKEEIAADILESLGLPMVHFSTGSTEPRELFDCIADSLGIGDTRSLTKPRAARMVVEAAGLDWSSDCESVGGTVTKIGILRVADAVQFFT